LVRPGTGPSGHPMQTASDCRVTSPVASLPPRYKPLQAPISPGDPTPTAAVGSTSPITKTATGTVGRRHCGSLVHGTVIDASSILFGTAPNCSGGRRGRGDVSLTEDRYVDRVYRFTPTVPGKLEAGVLKAASVGLSNIATETAPVAWHHRSQHLPPVCRPRDQRGHWHRIRPVRFTALGVVAARSRRRWQRRHVRDWRTIRRPGRQRQSCPRKTAASRATSVGFRQLLIGASTPVGPRPAAC
jgi:hypothetical protein